MEPVEQTEQEGSMSCNTKYRTWILVINNWSDEEWQETLNIFKTAVDYVLAKEVGTQGTRHLQCCVKWKNPRSFSGMKKAFPRAHIEVCKNWKASVQYCKKDGDYSCGHVETDHKDEYTRYMVQKYKDTVWKPWQQNIIEIINSEPDERTVYWFWEPEGNIGKSYLCKYLDWKYDAIIANGKQADVFNQYRMHLEEVKTQPKIAIIDIPRSHQEYVCYSTMEKIKDGLVYSGKYEGMKLRLIPHHLIVLANFEPDKSKLSSDRWQIVNLSG